MFYRVLLDCRPSGAVASQPFGTIKFVEADSQSEAMSIATEKTKLLMKIKGYDDATVSSFEFTIDEIELFNREDAVLASEQSFIYYLDD